MGDNVLIREGRTNMERGKTRINPVVLDWNCRYCCELVVVVIDR